jgi:cation diffusion facilitator family transporter
MSHDHEHESPHEIPDDGAGRDTDDHAREEPQDHAHDDGDAADGGDPHLHQGGPVGFIRSFLSPHSHDAMESIDQALTSTDEGVRALKVSLGVLTLTAAVELAITLVSSSIALLGDTIHNFADALTAIPLGLAFWLGRRAPTRRYTYGYGRAEDLAGIAIVATIAASSALAGFEAVSRLIHPHAVHDVGWVIAAAMVGFAGNELVAVYRIRIGRKIGSAALVADGLHARTDGVTSLAVVAGAIGVAAGWRTADPIVGLAITAAILFILKNAARDIYRRLMDSVEPGLVDQVETVLSRVEGVERVETVRVRWLGHELIAEARIVSDRDLSLAAAHDIAEEAHHRLLHDIPRLTEALIHSDPSDLTGQEPHSVTAHHFGAEPPRDQ